MAHSSLALFLGASAEGFLPRCLRFTSVNIHRVVTWWSTHILILGFTIVKPTVPCLNQTSVTMPFYDRF